MPLLPTPYFYRPDRNIPLYRFGVILAEVYDTMSDFIISDFLLVSLHSSQKSPDELYMFGRGRIQNVGGLIRGTEAIAPGVVTLHRLCNSPGFPDGIPESFNNVP